MAAPIIDAVIDEHFDTLSHLWDVRVRAVGAPHYRLLHLGRLDERLEANAEGLAIALRQGWTPPPADRLAGFLGDVFALALGLLRSGREADWLELAQTAGDDTFGPLVASLGWMEPKALGGIVRALKATDGPRGRALWLAAHAVHRVDPGPALADVAADAAPLVRARALRAIGELGRLDLAPLAAAALKDPDESCLFWGAWSAARLGDTDAAARLLGFAGAPGPLGLRALRLGLRALDRDAAKAYAQRARDDGVLPPRRVVEAAGIIGDPVALPWLLKQMQDLTLVRAAGEAWSLITGQDLAYEDLETERPDGFQSGPTENPADEEVALDDDDDLPWPDAAKLETWFKANRGRFAAGQRTLLGRPIAKDSCRRALAEGFQRQRIAAALELAVMEPQAPLFATSAPTRRQRALLGAGGRQA